MKSFLFLLFCSLIAINSNAQNSINGVVIDAQTKEAIPYVNIGILHATNGTVTDLKGRFILTNVNKGAKIKVSCIGFDDQEFTSEELLNIETILLNPRAYNIPDLTIIGRRIQPQKRIGKKIKNTDNVISWGLSAQLGKEIGSVIKIKKETVIKSAHIGFSVASEENILLRINLYDYSDNQLGANLLPEQIFIRSKSVTEDVKIDLSRYNIIVDDHVLLSVEAIERGPNGTTGELDFKPKSGFKSNIYQRNASQSDFYKFKDAFGLGKSTIGFYLIVKETE